MTEKWKSLEDRPKSTVFYCGKCGGKVYWQQAMRRKDRTRECPYPMCPWCGEKKDGAEQE